MIKHQFNWVLKVTCMGLFAASAPSMYAATPTCNGMTATVVITSPYTQMHEQDKELVWNDTPGDDVVVVDATYGVPGHQSSDEIFFNNLGCIAKTGQVCVMPQKLLIFNFTKGSDSICVKASYLIEPHQDGLENRAVLHSEAVKVVNADYIKDEMEGSYSIIEARPGAKIKVKNRENVFINIPKTDDSSNDKGTDIDLSEITGKVDIDINSNGNDDVQVHKIAGNDTAVSIDVGNGNDFVYINSYEGDDSKFNVLIKGGNGDDVLQSWTAGNVAIIGGAGSDQIDSSGAINFLAGGYKTVSADDLKNLSSKSYDSFMKDYDPTDDGDTISVTQGKNLILGTNGKDTLLGGTNKDDIHGYDDDDFIDGGADNDKLFGDDGNDEIYGGTGADTIYGGDGLNLLHGDSGLDFIQGGKDKDRIWGWTGNDQLFGGDGDNEIYGENGDDFIEGGKGKDLIKGGNDDDVIWGGAGDDRLYGNDGDDYLNGREGTDTLDGGGDSDTCIDSSGTSKTSCEH